MSSAITNKMGPTAANGRARDITNNEHDYVAGGDLEQAQSMSQYGTEEDSARKRLARLQAEFARRGYSLDALAADGFLVHRWGLTRNLPTLDDAEVWLQRIGGAA